MSSKYDLLVFLGRFSPFHAGHRRVVVELAFEQAHHVLILVGSSFQPRTIKNPFTYDERQQMILASLDPQHVSRLTIRPIRDYLYNEQQWIAQVQQNIDVIDWSRIVPGNPPSRSLKIGIIGYEKDQSSYYLRLFPQYEFVEVGKNYVDVMDATTIRELWLSGQSPRFTESAIHSYVHDFLYNKFPKKERDRLARELEHMVDYKKQWANSPYPVQFNTVDAVVIQSGHVLVIRRKSSPGENLIALVGGFLNQNETIEDGMIRELKEETRIKVPEPVIRGNIRARKVYDAPNRSLRGRTITHAFLIELPPGPLPKVKGSDDAAKAFWMPLSDVQKHEDQFFEDHFYIIQNLLGQGS